VLNFGKIKKCAPVPPSKVVYPEKNVDSPADYLLALIKYVVVFGDRTLNQWSG
jgi:hypothetical protein